MTQSAIRQHQTGGWHGPAKQGRSVHPYRRRGSIYAAVLGCSLAVTVIGLSALLALRVERRFAEGTGDFSQARLYAYSAIEDGLFRIQEDTDWRNTYPNGVWKSAAPIGTGTYTLIGEDLLDGDLTDSNSDSVVLTGIGIQGDARYKLQVRLDADTSPLSCLEVSLQAGYDLALSASVRSVTVNGDQIVSANNIMQATTDGAQHDPTTVTVYPDMEAVNGFSGTLEPGSKSVLDPPREMPDEATVLGYYADDANATPIDWSSLPGDVDVRRLEKIVLSPNSNPYGPTNPDGVYKIDCEGLEVVISDCRIVGTLVLINPRSTSVISGSVNWEAAVTNYPALVVGGTIKMWQSSYPLDEVTNGVNFNPPGTPYLGSEDGLIDDQYPSRISGLVYVSGNLMAQRTDDADTITINGVVIVGSTFNFVGSSFDLTYDRKYYDNPPPGFGSSAQMVISPGSWRQVVD